MGLCFVVFLLTVGLSDPVGRAHEARLDDAFSYWEKHPYLEPPRRLAQAYGDPGERAREEFYEAWERNGFPPVPEDLLQQEQVALDGLVQEAESILRNHVFYRYGLVPGRPTLVGAIGHLFLHAGWLHLAGNLLFLFLSGPLIESRYGRGKYLLFYLLSGFAAAGLFVLRHPGTSDPLVGASGAIAGVMGAFLVCFARTQIRFGYWLGFFWGTVKAPAGLILPLWFAGELFSARLGEMSGVHTGVAYWAHVGGFVFGVLGAFGLRALGREWIPEPPSEEELEADTLPTLDGVQSASAELRESRPRDAVELLRSEVLEGGEELEPALAFAEAAAAVPLVPDASRVIALPLAAAAREGQRAAAVRLWTLLRKAVAVPECDPETGLRLGGWLQNHDFGAARSALFAALRSGDAVIASRVARLARGFDPVLAHRAARRALALPGLPASDGPPMEALASESARAVEAHGIVMLPEGVIRQRPFPPKEPSASPAVRPRRSADPRDPWASRAVDLPVSDSAIVKTRGRGVDPPPPEEAAPQSEAASPAPEPEIDPWSGRAIELPEEEIAAPSAPETPAAPVAPAGPEYGQLEPEALGETMLASEPPKTATRSFERPPSEPAREEKGDPPAAPRSLRILRARPIRLGRQHLWVEVEGRGKTRLPYGRIQALALAGIRGLGRPRKAGSDRARAVVIVDLALNWRSQSGELLIMRLRSDGFDPRKLVDFEGSPLEALRDVVSILLKRSRAEALTPAASSRDEALQLETSLAAYESRILGARPS